MGTMDAIRQLREKSGAGVLDCKQALDESKGDVNLAQEILRKKGLAKLEKRVGKQALEGLVDAYIHPGGKVGVMAEVNCETDFVARTPEFKQLVRDLCLQVAAMCPRYRKREDVPEAVVEKEKEIYRAEAKSSGKPDKIIDKIAQGKLEKFYSEVCLWDQRFIRDDSVSFGEYFQSTSVRLGENVQLRKFLRYQLGEESS
ncbi:MAG: translation elongation factor Ts [Proteobacteria bacterium]|nr:translation elongation factor Ts [Pseudomonadota bacterium]